LGLVWQRECSLFYTFLDSFFGDAINVHVGSLQ